MSLVDHPNIIKLYESHNLVLINNNHDCYQDVDEEAGDEKKRYISSVERSSSHDQMKGQKLVSLLIMEYASLGNLYSYVQHQAFSENTTRYVFTELLRAVAYLHKNNIIHRDIKLENILFDKFFQIKLADFGFATLSSGTNNDYKHYTCKGTLNYLAPEIYN